MFFLNDNKILPVVVIKNFDDTKCILESLKNGGINVAEITFRTDCAAKAIAYGVRNYPNMLIGAGTIISAEQCENAIEAGAKFIVSPGFSEAVCFVCKKYAIPYLPGVATPTDIIAAVSNGYNLLKFFPAKVGGGIEMLKALAAAFPNVKFVPTGGIDESNVLEYLSLPFVAAIGGSFMFNDGLENIAAKTKNAVKLVEEL